MADPVIPAPGDAETLQWSIGRVEMMAGCCRLNAEKFGVKLLKGHGYPDEVMRDAQDALALETVLAESRRLAGELEQANERTRQAMLREAGWMQQFHDQKELAERLAGEVERLRIERDSARELDEARADVSRLREQVREA
jgi:hypothetical protein